MEDPNAALLAEFSHGEILPFMPDVYLPQFTGEFGVLGPPFPPAQGAEVAEPEALPPALPPMIPVEIPYAYIQPVQVPEEVFVPGQLGWPSDHAPGVVELVQLNPLDGASVTCLAMTFNILNHKHMHWLEKDDNLKGTTLMTMTQEQREAEILQIIMKALRRASIVCLQEVSTSFVAKLKQQLASERLPREDGDGFSPNTALLDMVAIEFAPDFDDPSEGGVICYDKRLWMREIGGESRPYLVVAEKKQDEPDYVQRRSYMQIVPLRHIRHQEWMILMINTHTPFGYVSQLAEVLTALANPTYPVVCMGDLNVGLLDRDPRPESNGWALELLNLPAYTWWTQYTDYTHVNKSGKLDVFDHVLTTRQIGVHFRPDIEELLRSSYTLGSRTSPTPVISVQMPIDE